MLKGLFHLRLGHRADLVVDHVVVPLSLWQCTVLLRGA
jgi:hypothetical protein